MNDSRDDLILAQQEYIEFLENIVNKNAEYLENHGIMESLENMDKGFQLRSEIIIIKEQIGLI